MRIYKIFNLYKIYYDRRQGAGYKTLHKITVRSYKQPFRGKNLKKRGLIPTESEKRPFANFCLQKKVRF